MKILSDSEYNQLLSKINHREERQEQRQNSWDSFLSDGIQTVEITQEWQQRNGETAYSAMAKRVAFNGGSFSIAGNEFAIYDPRTSSQPDSSVGDRMSVVYRGRWEVIGGGGAPSGELGWGTPLSSMSPLNGAMVTKARKYPESDVDRYRRDIVYLGKEWENCIVREGTPISYYAARPLEQLPKLSSATRSAAGLAKLGVVSPNYLSPLAKVPWETSSYYFSMTLAEDESKYTINWRDNTNGTPRFRYRIDIMTHRVTRNIVSAATSGTLDWTLPDLFCLYGIPIDASENVISDQYANSHAVFIDPSALKPKGVITMYLPGGESEEEPANANSYLYTGGTYHYVSMYFRPNFMPSISQQEFFDLFTMECRADEQAWTPWGNGYAQSSTALRIGTQIEYNNPFEFSVRCTSRTTGRTQYTESMGWYIVTD